MDQGMDGSLNNYRRGERSRVCFLNGIQPLSTGGQDRVIQSFRLSFTSP